MSPRLSRTTKSTIGGSPSRFHFWSRNICTNNPQLAYPPDFRSATPRGGQAGRERAQASSRSGGPTKHAATARKSGSEGLKNMSKIAEVHPGIYEIFLPLPMRPTIINVYLIDCHGAWAL